MYFPLFYVTAVFDQIFHCVQPNWLDYETASLDIFKFPDLLEQKFMFFYGKLANF